MNSSKISVIIPVYNTAPYLKRCLDSVLLSDYQNLEIICINDGSTDNSLEILSSYRSDNRVHIINQVNKGVSAARNRGLEMCSGDVIAFIDSDDMIHPCFFSILYEYLEKKEADVAACDYVKFTDEKELAPLSEQKMDIEAKLMSPLGIINTDHLNRYVWGRIYRKSLLDGLQFDEEIQLGEDTAYNLQALCRKENLNFQYISLPLYYYFKREDSAVSLLDHSLAVRGVKNVYLKYYEDFGCNKAIILEQAMRSLMLERYVDEIKEVQDYIAEYNSMLSECLTHLHDLSKVKRIVYYIFAKIPAAYRLFRLFGDPTLLIWEKNIKKKIRDGKD